MDGVDQQLVETVKKLLGRVCPGVVEALAGIPGEYLPTSPYRMVPPARGRPQVIQLTIKYLAKDRKGQAVYLKLSLTAERQAEWKIVEHCYHFGPNPLSDDGDDSCTYFRICQRNGRPYHFHKYGYERFYDGGHIPAEKATPALQTDPIWFLGLFKTFLETNHISIDIKAIP